MIKESKSSVYNTHVLAGRGYRYSTGGSIDASSSDHFQKLSVGKMPALKNAKEMVIDFLCREDLAITTLKEFFEIFVSSIKKEQVFHLELLNSKY